MAPRARLVSLVVTGFALVASVACNKPKVGGKCDVGQALCEGATTVLACRNGTFTEAQCHGPAGCTRVGARVTCDDSTADVGDACLDGDAPNRACARDQKSSLVCDKGAFKSVQICRGPSGCKITGDAVSCDTTRASKGDMCTTQGAFACTPDLKARIVCNNGTYVNDRLCRGATGCHPTDFACDETVSEIGDPCGMTGTVACSSDGWSELVCQSGAWFANRSCKKGCKVSGTKIQCLLN